jgi:hypothetical protein
MSYLDVPPLSKSALRSGQHRFSAIDRNDVNIGHPLPPPPSQYHLKKRACSDGDFEVVAPYVRSKETQLMG